MTELCGACGRKVNSRGILYYIGITLGDFCSDCHNDIGQCCLCHKKIGFSSSRPTCFGLRVCGDCYQPSKVKPGKSVGRNKHLVQKHQQTYKKFLQGKLYSEVTVWHKAADGCETITPISKDFFQ